MPLTKEDIRERTDIVDLIGASIALKRRGRNFIGLCPFHNEKTPSFNVDSNFKTFKCFGCGAGGDVFDFVEKYQNMEFVEAAEFLARRLGDTFQRLGGAQTAEKLSEREQIHAINGLAASFFRESLGRAPVARDYLHERGLAHDTITRFQLGYAPQDWDALVRYLAKQRTDLKVAETAGVVRMGEKGYYDVFRHRIIFPIHDEQERIVGFGGRAFGDDTPKYLNTGDTPVFAKSKLLYGLPFARRAIAAEGKSLLMEGYMDVLAAHQAGFTNAVATLGTALTEEHAKRLKRLADVVVLVYDADNAGIKATLRGSEILEQQEVDVRVVRLPKGDDPDSLLKRGETAAFQRAIDEAENRVEYLASHAATLHDPANPDSRTRFFDSLYRILSRVGNGALRDEQLLRYARHHPLAVHGLPSALAQMQRELAERRQGGKRAAPQAQQADPTAGLAEIDSRRRAIELQLETLPQNSPARPPLLAELRKLRYSTPKIAPATVGTGGLTAEARAERELMRALVDSDWCGGVLRHVKPEHFASPLARRLCALVEANLEEIQSGRVDVPTLLIMHEDEGESLAIRQELQEITALMAKVPLTEAGIEGCAKTLRLHRIRSVKREMAQLLQSKPELTEEDRERVVAYQKLLAELAGSEKPDSRRE